MRKAAFIVIAEFEVSAPHRDEFLDLCTFDAQRSTGDEPGCRQFDVGVSQENPGSIVLYEIYDDRAAFDAHMTMPHYKVFAEGVTRLGVQKISVRFFVRQHP